MNTIAILTDSGSGLTPAEAESLGITLLPLQVLLDGRSYRDGVDIRTEEIYEALRNRKYPKTASPLYQSIEDCLSELKTQGKTQVIAIPLSSGLSSTYQSMVLAAESVGIEMILIDVYSTCMIQNHVARLARRLADKGLDAETIKEKIEAVIAQANTLILPNDMEHLKAGGRLTPIAASLAAMFKIRPILQLNRTVSGKIDVLDKVRTERKALEQTLSTLHRDFSGKNCSVYIIHSDAQPRTEAAREALLALGYPEARIQVKAIAPVIAAHTGLDCLGIQFIEDIA